MQVNGLDHVNIVARDLARTIEFYEQVLDMRAEVISIAPPGFDGRWIFDKQGHPVIHVQGYNPERHGTLGADAASTGSIDHVALRCSGFDAMVRRCTELGIEHRVNDRQMAGLRQIFVTDPDNVVLELNFPDD